MVLLHCSLLCACFAWCALLCLPLLLSAKSHPHKPAYPCCLLRVRVFCTICQSAPSGHTCPFHSGAICACIMQATRKDIMGLFTPFGQIKSCRLPRKFDGNHRCGGEATGGSARLLHRQHEQLLFTCGPEPALSAAAPPARVLV